MKISMQESVNCVYFLPSCRQELIDHYSKLSDDAARREQRALWKMQRHKLETARLKFLLEDQKRIEVSSEKDLR